MSLFAAIGTLSLAIIVAIAGSRSRGSAVARPLSALCIVLFGWNFCVVARRLARASGGEASDAFEVLDAVFTALSPPLVFEVVLAFLGETKRHRIVRGILWVVFGGLAAGALGGLALPALLRWLNEASWSVVFLSGWITSFVQAVLLLGRYIRRTDDAREKARARVVLAALAIGGSFSMSDVVNQLGLSAPYLGGLGTLIAAALLTTLVVRFELFERSVSARTTLYVIGMIAAFIAAYVVALGALAGRLAAQLFVAAVLALLVAMVARELALSVADARARAQRLALLGRFSAQMAHDIKGPLTALLGATELLEGEEGEAGGNAEYLDLVRQQAKRIATIVERYDRMARIEPQKTLVPIHGVIRAVARTHGLPPESLSLAPEDPECDADRALIEAALENVVRNALEASTEPAKVRIETALVPSRGLVIRVIDRGSGMDARVLERATEDFFTTKASGSGLGLAFARRVVEAHGGAIALTSRPGRGTTVELLLLV
jgi:signal transduction histidine kinase